MQTRKKLPNPQSGVAGRLGEIIKTYPQAEISRRTGVADSCVSRYLAGTRIPADFCTALVRELGVNPAWLLMGEGTPYLADITASTTETAADLLELVQAMSAVAKLRLGELSGQPDRKVLRELNDTLHTHERLRERLNSQSRPFFSKLIEDMRSATRKGDFPRAFELNKAALQVSRLCDDQDLVEDFESAQGYLLHSSGDREGALEIARRTVMRYFVSGPGHEHFSVEINNYIIALADVGRVTEARRVCACVTAMLEPDPRYEADYRDFLLLAASLDLDAGNLLAAQAKIAQAVPDLESRKPVSTNVVVRAQLLAGLQGLESALEIGHDSPSKASTAVIFAIWLEDLHLLRLVWNRFAAEKGRLDPARLPADSRGMVALRGIIDALAGPRNQALAALKSDLKDGGKNWREDAPSAPMSAMARATWLAQRALLLGEKALARRLTLEAETHFSAVPDELTPKLMPMAIHYHNVLRLIAPSAKGRRERALRERARGWFADMYARGYGCFRQLARE